MTPRHVAAEASRLTEAILAGLKRRYGEALAWKAAHPGETMPGHLYALWSDYRAAIEELHATDRMSERGMMRKLREMVERYGDKESER